MALFRKRIKRVGPGRYRIDLPGPEQELLRSLAPQLRELLTTDDPSLRRLFPTAYPDDPERDAGYHALVRDELLGRHFAALDLLETTLDAREVSEAELGAWMRAVNDLRLVLGTRLDVTEDLHEIDVDDPDAPAYAVYDYLGMLLTFVIDALAQDLDDEGTEGLGPPVGP